MSQIIGYVIPVEGGPPKTPPFDHVKAMVEEVMASHPNALWPTSSMRVDELERRIALLERHNARSLVRLVPRAKATKRKTAARKRRTTRRKK